MHNNQYHRAVAPSAASGGGGRGGPSRRAGAGGGGGERRLGLLEAVALAIVFIVGVSFGMYLEGRQHHDELRSFASPKVRRRRMGVFCLPLAGCGRIVLYAVMYRGRPLV